MYLKRKPGVEFSVMKVPYCASFVHISCDCMLTSEEQRAVYNALYCFENEIRVNPPKVYPPVKCEIVITANEEITFGLEDAPDALGHNARLIVIYVDRMRTYVHRDIHSLLLQCVLEELCHCHYSVDDELAVDDYVIACARHLLPELKYEDWYDPDWKP